MRMSFWESVIFWVVTGGLGFAAKCLWRESKKLSAARESENKKQQAVMDGVRAILRDRILHTYGHYSEKGWVPFYAMENMDNMYNAYHDLGGNGPITEIYHKFMNLPQAEP